MGGIAQTRSCTSTIGTAAIKPANMARENKMRTAFMLLDFYAGLVVRV